MTDDAAGPLVIDELFKLAIPHITLRDGGTMGMSLLPDIEDADIVIVIDAAYFGGEPGDIQIFEGEAMDRQLGGVKKTAHEVALSDLMSAAALQEMLPQRRALVAVQPCKISLGLDPTCAVAAAIPLMVRAVQRIADDWHAERLAA